MFPPHEGFEEFDEEVNDEEWDKSDNKNVADSDDTHIWQNGGSL